MASLFEYCFYAGVILAVVSLAWLLATLTRGQSRKAVVPLCLLLFAGALIVGPAVLSRSLAVDLGPREKIVQGERHVSLTGWDGDSYNFLAAKSDTVVLQMGNGDVTDATLDLLANMRQLRELDLNDSAVTDAGLAKLARLPNLQTLRLRGTRITDAGFREHLMNSPSLEQLDVRQTSVSVEAIEAWTNAAVGRRAFR